MSSNVGSNLMSAALALAGLWVCTSVALTPPTPLEPIVDPVQPNPAVVEPEGEESVEVATPTAIVLPPPPVSGSVPTPTGSTPPTIATAAQVAHPQRQTLAPPSLPLQRKPDLSETRKTAIAAEIAPTIQVNALVPTQSAPLASANIEPLESERRAPTPLRRVLEPRDIEPAETDARDARESTSSIPIEQPQKPAVTTPSEDANARVQDVEVQLGDRQNAVAQSGRALLRVLELGSGPEIHIDWPDSQVGRDALYTEMTTCYGVETALLDARGELFALEARRVSASSGQPARWKPNTDYYSGFMREVEGVLPSRERERAREIRARHPKSRSASVVRLFPRDVDSVLLGGLKRLLSDRYSDASQIRARYVLEQGTLRVTDIVADGVAINGAVKIAPASGCVPG